MRRLELLSQEVRQTTDTEDIESINTYELMRYFRDAQRTIQKIIFTVNPDAEMFQREQMYTPSSTDNRYNLPSDIYANSAVTSLLSVDSTGRVLYTIPKLSFREVRVKIGYALKGNQFILTNPNQYRRVLMTYVYKLATPSYRLGQVSAVNAATGVVSVSGSTLIDDTDFTEYYDRYSIVDSDGANLLDANGDRAAINLKLTNYAGTSFTFQGDISAVSVGDWIVAGSDATTHMELPDECEPFLLAHVGRRIAAKLSSTDVQLDSLLTSEERADLEDLFANNVKDIFYPVSSDGYYLEY